MPIPINFFDEHTTPFFDFKAGYSYLDGKGVFINPAFGFSFGKGRKKAFNIAAGYSFQKARMKDKGVINTRDYHGVSIRGTFEFAF